MIRIELPEKVHQIIDTIQDAGYEAYAVGGCVRDSILGRKPQDWDITTSAKPEQVKALFRRTIDTGIQHGTVTVMLGNEGFEVTTYRVDGEYEDSRHPKEVTFTANLEEDLKRRDFTINAMAYNERDGLVDLFEGQSDLERKVLRCVGDPMERFDEDALRMLRAVRFTAQLGLTIDERTSKAITVLAPNLQKISAERIATELNKLVVSPHPDYIRIAYETGITAQILPEINRCFETEQHNPHHCYTVGEHIMHTMQAVKPDKYYRLAMLFHDIGKPQCLATDEQGIDHFHGHPDVGEKMTREILRRLKYDNETVRIVTALVKYHDRNLGETPTSVRRTIYKVGEDIYPMLFEVKRADVEGQSDYKRKEKDDALALSVKLYEEVIAKKECVSLKQLAVDGKDLIALGIKPGPEIGKILAMLLEKVLEDPSLNSKEKLLSFFPFV